MPECSKTDEGMDDFQPIPDWLTTEYVENALRSYTHDTSLKIVEIQIKPATGKGENYASVMSRVGVKYLTDDQPEPQIGSYLIKTSFEADEFANEIFGPYDIYRREMDIYGIIFPKLKDLLKASGFTEDIVPHTISIDYDRSSIIFEDLSVKSYVMPDRRNGLDATHTKMILRKLAKMQAASAALSNLEPETFRSYDRGFFNRHTESISPMYVNNLDTCGKLVSKWPGFEKYGEKLLKLKTMVMEHGKRAFDAKDVHVNVLTHGDLWVNNVMFKYNSNNEPIDVILIDFQYSCYASPTLDLHYYMSTSLTDELAKHHEEFVHYYYEHFAETLRSLQFKGTIPTLKQFWLEYMKKSFYAFTSTCLIKPIMINEHTEDADLASLMKDDEKAWRFKRTIYSNEKVQKNLKRVLPIFDRQGLLDTCQ